jgi:hypothetical protein
VTVSPRAYHGDPYFSHFHRWMGAASVAVARGPVNSGYFVESDIGPSAPATSR